MIPAKIEVDINQDEIKNYIKEQVDQQLRHEFLFVDVNKLADMISVSKRWLEEHLLGDPRVMVCMRQKNRKRLYLYPDVIEAIRSISDEW